MNPKFERAIGKLLRGVRANEKYLALHDHRFTATPVSISLTSSAFVEGGAMPKRYAGQGVGDNLSPPLGWADLPAATRELVLIMQDPNAPLPRPVTHVAVTGIPVGWTGLAEGALAATAGPPLAFAQGSFGRTGYAGPRPVLGHGAHRYVFQLFASNRRLDFARPPNRAELMAALAGTVIGKGRLDGFVERK